MKKKTVLASVIMLALLNGCGGKDASQHYADAQQYISEHKYNAAIIELKSAIQQAPDNTEYRLALGNLYLQDGNAIFAQKELLRAKESGVPPEQVALNLVRASYLSGLHQDVLALYSEDNATLTEPLASYLQVYRALSELELGASDKALEMFSTLAAIEQADIASFAQANMLIPANQYQDAIAKTNEIITESPIYQEALYLRGNLQLMMQQYEDATSTLKEYIQAQPLNLRAHLLMAQAKLKLSQLPEAARHADVVLKVLPDHAYANYLKAITEFEAKQYGTAKEFVEKAINNGYRTAPARVVAALSSYQLGLNAQALNHLSAIEKQLDAYPDAKRLYIGLQVQAGNTVDAKDMLQASDISTADLNLIASTAFTLIKQGSTDAARELITKYENAGYDDLASLTMMGTVKLGIKGQEEAGINDLELALQMDPSQDKTRLILASSYLRLKQYDKVTALADEWVKKPDTAVAGYNLKAYAAVLQQDMATAEVNIKQSLALDENSALANLLNASIMAYNKDYQQADTVLQKLLQQHPTYLPAITQYFYVSRQLNKENDAVQYAEDTLAKNTNLYALRIFLARYHYLHQHYEQTLSLLSGVDTEQQLPSSHWIILIDSYYKQNKISDATATAQKWLKMNPDDTRAAMAYVEILRRQKRFSDAISVLDQQILRQPNQHALKLTKLHLLTDNQQLDNALALIKQLPAELANRPDVLLIKGKIQLNQGQRSAGLNDFLRSYEAAPEHNTAMIIADTYVKDYSLRQGVEFIEAHMKKHGTTNTVDAFYANLLIQNDAGRAEAIYSQLLEKSPENLILLNNYAWLLYNNGKVAEARTYAEKALKQAPENADINDTYGAILLKLNKASEAIPYFKKALSIRPDYDEAKLNYAEALILTNDKAGAAELLKSVVSSDPRLTQRKLRLNQQI